MPDFLTDIRKSERKHKIPVEINKFETEFRIIQISVKYCQTSDRDTEL